MMGGGPEDMASRDHSTHHESGHDQSTHQDHSTHQEGGHDHGSHHHANHPHQTSHDHTQHGASRQVGHEESALPLDEPKHRPQHP
jgi:hypothetical protein